jgi:hypothetical protein
MVIFDTDFDISSQHVPESISLIPLLRPIQYPSNVDVNDEITDVRSSESQDVRKMIVGASG